jgi:hypothetical protein
MNAAEQSSLVYPPSADARTLGESRWRALGRRLASWPVPVCVGILLGPVFAAGWVDGLTGMGLTLVRRIIKTHADSVRWSNRNESGARATLQFNTEPKDQP